MCISASLLSLTPPLWKCSLGLLLLALVLSPRFINLCCWLGVQLMVLSLDLERPSSDPHQFALASAMTAKSAYLYLLSANFVPPHCEETFLPLYGSLYWSATWRQPGFCPVDRAVIDVAWQVVHGVLYTADRLISFGYDYDPNCFCGSPETPSHLFFECALAQSVLGWI